MLGLPSALARLDCGLRQRSLASRHADQAWLIAVAAGFGVAGVSTTSPLNMHASPARLACSSSSPSLFDARVRLGSVCVLIAVAAPRRSACTLISSAVSPGVAAAGSRRRHSFALDTPVYLARLACSSPSPSASAWLLRATGIGTALPLSVLVMLDSACAFITVDASRRAACVLVVSPSAMAWLLRAAGGSAAFPSTRWFVFARLACSSPSLPRFARLACSPPSPPRLARLVCSPPSPSALAWRLSAAGDSTASPPDTRVCLRSPF